MTEGSGHVGNAGLDGEDRRDWMLSHCWNDDYVVCRDVRCRTFGINSNVKQQDHGLGPKTPKSAGSSQQLA
jgi:hypothetical protein